MSRAADELVCEPRERREIDAHEPQVHAFWQWFALGVLALCWIAEAALGAASGA